MQKRYKLSKTNYQIVQNWLSVAEAGNKLKGGGAYFILYGGVYYKEYIRCVFNILLMFTHALGT